MAHRKRALNAGKGIDSEHVPAVAVELLDYLPADWEF